MPVLVGSGVILDGLTFVDGVLRAVENTSTVTFPQSPGNTHRARVRVPSGGATLARITVRTVTTVSNSAAGTYVMAAVKEVDGGGTTNMLESANFNLEGLVAQTEQDPVLTVTTANLDCADGTYILISIASDNADLTGGTGVLVSVVWAVNGVTGVDCYGNAYVVDGGVAPNYPYWFGKFYTMVPLDDLTSPFPGFTSSAV